MLILGWTRSQRGKPFYLAFGTDCVSRFTTPTVLCVSCGRGTSGHTGPLSSAGSEEALSRPPTSSFPTLSTGSAG